MSPWSNLHCAALGGLASITARHRLWSLKPSQAPTLNSLEECGHRTGSRRPIFVANSNLVVFLELGTPPRQRRAQVPSQSLVSGSYYQLNHSWDLFAPSLFSPTAQRIGRPPNKALVCLRCLLFPLLPLPLHCIITHLTPFQTIHQQQLKQQTSSKMVKAGKNQSRQ